MIWMQPKCVASPIPPDPVVALMTDVNSVLQKDAAPSCVVSPIPPVPVVMKSLLPLQPQLLLVSNK